MVKSLYLFNYYYYYYYLILKLTRLDIKLMYETLLFVKECIHNLPFRVLRHQIDV